jgi:RNA polymerase sigma factor (sigma-70 family)
MPPAAGVRVIVEARRSDRRRGGDRRTGGSANAPAAERRRVRASAGRRVGERRAALTPVRPPADTPAALRRHLRDLRFVRREPPLLHDVEDLETARLVIRLQRGEPGAFDEIYERYMARVYGYLRVALRDEHEAEDATHEVFISVLKALPRFEVQGVPFRVWLFRIVRNHAVNHLRKHRRMEVMDPDEVMQRLNRELNPAEAEVLAGVDDGEMLRLIECLPVVQRQVVVLRYVMGFCLADVARVLGRSPNAVSQLQRRAFAILSERLVARGRAPDVAPVRLPMRGRLLWRLAA